MSSIIHVYNAAGTYKGSINELFSNVVVGEQSTEIGYCNLTISYKRWLDLGMSEGYYFDLAIGAAAKTLGRYYIKTFLIDVLLDTVTITSDLATVLMTRDVIGSGISYAQQLVLSTIGAACVTTGSPGMLAQTVNLTSEPLVDMIFENESYWSGLKTCLKYVQGFGAYDYNNYLGGSSQRYKMIGPYSAAAMATLLAGAGSYFTLYNSGSHDPVLDKIPNVSGPIQTGNNIATKVTRLSDGINIVNSVVSYGGGIYPLFDNSGTPVKIGEQKLTIQRSNRSTPYTRSYLSAKKMWYIEDATSVTTYGRRRKTISFPEINPLTTSDSDILNAANTLYDISAAYLTNKKDPSPAYEIELNYSMAEQLVPNVMFQIGTIIYLKYDGYVYPQNPEELPSYSSLNELFLVTGFEMEINSGDNYKLKLQVTRNPEMSLGFVDVVSDALADIKKFSVRQTPSLTYRTWNGCAQIVDNAAKNFTQWGTNAGDAWSTENVKAYFNIYFGAEALDLYEVQCDLIFIPLRQYLLTFSDGNGLISANNNVAAFPHTHTYQGIQPANNTNKWRDAKYRSTTALRHLWLSDVTNQTPNCQITVNAQVINIGYTSGFTNTKITNSYSIYTLDDSFQYKGNKLLTGGQALADYIKSITNWRTTAIPIVVSTSNAVYGGTTYNGEDVICMPSITARMSILPVKIG